MEKRIININFNKSGSGSYTPRITLPMVWVKEVGLSQEDRQVEITFDGEEIRIRKVKEAEE